MPFNKMTVFKRNTFERCFNTVVRLRGQWMERELSNLVEQINLLHIKSTSG